MKYFELICTVFIKVDIEFINSFDVISKFINFSMLKNDKLKDFHQQKGYKYYSFGGFYPLEKDKLYKKGRVYKFTLRSLDERFIDSLSTLLKENINNHFLQIVETNKKIVKQFFITELYSVTPVIVSLPRQKGEKQMFWSIKDDIFILQKQLQNNLLKKYKSFYEKDLEPTQNFIQLFEIKNQKPQSIYFTKKINDKKEQKVRLFGNKFKIIVNEDEISQKLAFTALACGLGERQSYGGGFCLWN
ncbi:CRISPR-associated endoribonuclease Cas6 [Malaciobacter halophilus]|uniref:CRISPR-associated endoribonuclease Cas6 n=1 Tax=Malaciobacter halophilus TaxID=197482 RepID=A0A2N1J006_9BACT|nr:CRISPR-associated endoribonuclease Cas6 [Malaciobacter halophilus]AXH10457.1 CRISPR/Cas system-associated RAMP protein Cas6, type I-B [Malaciobacter halophilus]PKI79890.1 CRISPR-associated endoribonuclease Cas6 [Malaciobacter halophilus]